MDGRIVFYLNGAEVASVAFTQLLVSVRGAYVNAEGAPTGGAPVLQGWRGRMSVRDNATMVAMLHTRYSARQQPRVPFHADVVTEGHCYGEVSWDYDSHVITWQCSTDREPI